MIEGGSRSYDTPSAADGDALATALFALGKVTTVFYMPGFVTVNKQEGADWGSLAPAVARTIETSAVTSSASAESAGPTGGLMDRINHVLDTQIRPALAGDGGGLEVVSLEGKNLTIQYQGACGSCPSAQAGTLAAIQNLLQAEIDEELVVVPA